MLNGRNEWDHQALFLHQRRQGAIDTALTSSDLVTEVHQLFPQPAWLVALAAAECAGATFTYQPCDDSDIAELRAHAAALNQAALDHECCTDIKFPLQYLRFLKLMGRGSNLLFIGEDIFFPDVLSFRVRATGLLAESDTGLELSSESFVFFIHQDSVFLFFHLGESDDPVIYGYDARDEAVCFFTAYSSFSDFMRIYIEIHRDSYDTLKAIYTTPENLMPSLPDSALDEGKYDGR